jgi:uncharacterized membrane protein YphA (DoxX/SURF4 family)
MSVYKKFIDPPIAEVVFSSTGSSWFWLLVRLYVGWEWLVAGWAKVGSDAWTGAGAGTALTGFLNGALAKTVGAHPDVQSWYAWFIKAAVLAHPVVWSYVVAWGELLVGIALIVGIFTGMQYEDSTLPLTVAEKTLGFQKDQYSVLGDLLKQVFGASEKDVANIVEASKYGKAEEKKDAQDVIDRAIQLANLANSTPAGTVHDIAGTKVVGTKSSSGSDGGGSSSDIEAYALELLNNPNFTASNVPQNIRAQVLQKRDQIVAEANAQQQADAAAAQALKSGQPKITAQDFGAGVKDTFTQTIPNLAKSGFNTTKDFFKGLFGIGY